MVVSGHSLEWYQHSRSVFALYHTRCCSPRAKQQNKRCCVSTFAGTSSTPRGNLISWYSPYGELSLSYTMTTVKWPKGGRVRYSESSLQRDQEVSCSMPQQPAAFHTHAGRQESRAPPAAAAAAAAARVRYNMTAARGRRPYVHIRDSHAVVSAR